MWWYCWRPQLSSMGIHDMITNSHCQPDIVIHREFALARLMSWWGRRSLRLPMTHQVYGIHHRPTHILDRFEIYFQLTARAKSTSISHKNQIKWTDQGIEKIDKVDQYVILDFLCDKNAHRSQIYIDKFARLIPPKSPPRLNRMMIKSLFQSHSMKILKPENLMSCFGK